MSVYVVIGGQNSDVLRDRIKSRFPNEFFEAFPTAWFVSAPLTTKEVSAALALPDGVSGDLRFGSPI